MSTRWGNDVATIGAEVDAGKIVGIAREAARTVVKTPIDSFIYVVGPAASGEAHESARKIEFHKRIK
jgi:hypothetical protein